MRSSPRRVRQADHAAALAAAAMEKERLLVLASHLPLPDQALLHTLLREGLPVRSVAKLRSTTSRAVRRRAHVLVTRLRDPVFAVVIALGAGWPPRRRRIAHMSMVEGASSRAVCEHLEVSMHTVRRELAEVRAITEALVLTGRVPDLHGMSSAVAEFRRTA
jgi:hypothetical protein